MIERSYRDAFGTEHTVPDETLAAVDRAIGDVTEDGPLVTRSGQQFPVGDATVALEDGRILEVDGELPADLPIGYHRLHGPDSERLLIVSPGRCHVPEARVWGWAVQLYAARSAGSWGMGDLHDLRTLVEWGSQLGAGMVLTNPLGAVAPTRPQQPSPYFPASRRFLNPLYLRVEEVEGASAASEAVATAAKAGTALSAEPHIDRDAVWREKLTALEEIYRAAPRSDAYRAWRLDQGEELTQFATWCVLAERHGPDWRRWPGRLSHPDRPEVGEAAEREAGRVDFHSWLQWLCRVQLQRAVKGVMLMVDLPIGFDPGGADAWAWQDLLASDVTFGAPPDEFNTRGQDWGLPPFIPHRLRGVDYTPFIQTIRSNLVTGGGLRIDHVMGLFRQFWIPRGADPAAGTYVRFPSSDLLDIVCLESVRAQATVVGEDLGTVEAGVREELAARRLLSYRLLWFEEEEPSDWPELSLASITTHDLPTVTGLWTGSDLAEQTQLDLAPNVAATEGIRRRLGEAVGLTADSPVEEVTAGLHRRLSGASSRLICATLDDAALARRRPNIPGADGIRPNWAIPLPAPIEEITASAHAGTIARILDTGGVDDGT